MNIQYKNQVLEVKEKTKISELLKEEIQNSSHAVIAAKFNNEYVNLQYEIETDGIIELIDTSSKKGMRVYRKTLIYILGKAIEKIYPNAKFEVDYQLTNSLFCEIHNLDITDEVIRNLNEEVKKIIEENLPIEQKIMTREEAKEFFEKNKTTKGKLQYDLTSNSKIYMYFCEDYYNYCYETLSDRTGSVKVFEISKYKEGFLIRYPNYKEPEKLPPFVETKKLAYALKEYEDIHKILDVDTVYKLNKTVKENKVKEIIMLDEALHEKKISDIADNIAKDKNTKMVLIAGPSSSGKTTFAQRLGIQLKINGIKPVTISVDNYFVEREDNPKDENGEYDFECLEAIDLKLFNDHLTKLLNGEEVEMPTFNFHKGTKEYNGNKLKLNEDEVLVIEGIHCLNDELTKSISKEQKYKIYISALTVLNMDRFNRISTTDTRLIRRIVRDYQFRSYSAKETLAKWESVKRGEEKYIFPFQETADIIFNTSLIYELGAFKPIVLPLLEEIKQNEKEYAEAQRLINMLKYFEEIPSKLIPTNSLLKEFLGGGDFKY